jgi:hypothetical protein
MFVTERINLPLCTKDDALRQKSPKVHKAEVFTYSNNGHFIGELP